VEQASQISNIHAEQVGAVAADACVEIRRSCYLVEAAEIFY
jgi:hypothetical protein